MGAGLTPSDGPGRGPTAPTAPKLRGRWAEPFPRPPTAALAGVR